MSARRYCKRLSRRSQARKKKPRPTHRSTRRAHASKKKPRPSRRTTRPKGFPAKETVFLSYRSADVGWAWAVYFSLKQQGYDVFFDHQNIGNGLVKHVILKEIRRRAHFLVILTPDALEKCNIPGDWLRLETEQALATKRNIIPVMLEGFDFNTPAIAAKLTGKLALLKEYHGLRVSRDFFEHAMNTQLEKYLK